jgi:hypothetical protein
MKQSNDEEKKNTEKKILWVHNIDLANEKKGEFQTLFLHLK